MKLFLWFAKMCDEYWRVIIVIALLTNAIVDYRQSQEISTTIVGLQWIARDVKSILENGELNESCQH